MTIEIFVFRLAIAALILGVFIVAHRISSRKFNAQEIDLTRIGRVVAVVILWVVATFVALLSILFLFGGN